MGGSSGGGYDTVTIPSLDDYYDPNKDLFLGATSSQPVTSTDYAPVMTPGQPGVGGFNAPMSEGGPGSGSNLTTTVHPTGDKPQPPQSFGDWLMSKEGAAALQKTGESLKGPESGAKPPDPKVNPSQLGSGSQVVRGNTQTLSQLLQMLSQRRYSPIGYSGYSSGGSTRGGLLG